MRRSAMTLFSAPHDAWSHRTRIVLAEKGIPIEIIDVEPGRLPEDLLDLNPYHSVPTLVDRDLVLYDSRVIMEYLDETKPGSGLGLSIVSDLAEVYDFELAFEKSSLGGLKASVGLPALT